MNRSATRRVAALLVPGGLSVAALGLVAGIAQADPAPVIVIPEAAAQTVVDVVSDNTAFTPTDVTCPSGVQAKVGQQFECQFTGPEGPYTAYLQITKVDGTYVEYAITTRRD